MSFKTYPNWEVPDDVPFTNTVRNKFVRGAVAFWKTSVIAPFCRSHLTVENHSHAVGSQCGRGQRMALTAKSKVHMVTVVDSKIKAAIRII